MKENASGGDLLMIHMNLCKNWHLCIQEGISDGLETVFPGQTWRYWFVSLKHVTHDWNEHR